jgi:predicted site-specific integrase-resolvase
MSTDLSIPAAQYLRMSTEHQQYSLMNQAAAIERYAETHRVAVVRTYSDAAASGLVLKHRSGLRQLLHDVVGAQSGVQSYPGLRREPLGALSGLGRGGAL